MSESASNADPLSQSVSTSSSVSNQQGLPSSRNSMSNAIVRDTMHVPDPEYVTWLRIMHPSDANIAVCSSHSTAYKSSSLKTPSSSISPVLQEMLVLPIPNNSTGRKRKALNSI